MPCLKMRFGQRWLDLEYMRQDHRMLLTDDPSSKRALQFAASTASAGSGIANRFLTKHVADAYKKAVLSTPAPKLYPWTGPTRIHIPKNPKKTHSSKKHHKDAESQWDVLNRSMALCLWRFVCVANFRCFLTCVELDRIWCANSVCWWPSASTF